jgi:thymidylate synthase (FAD)
MIENNISRELARINLPINCYTEFYWKINLHNLLHFLYLRSDSHAQYEIREYAKEILNIVKVWVPFTYESYKNHRLDSVSFSAKELNIIKKIINKNVISQEESLLSKREYEEFINKLTD